jgi:hypothetical protein
MGDQLWESLADEAEDLDMSRAEYCRLLIREGSESDSLPPNTDAADLDKRVTDIEDRLESLDELEAVVDSVRNLESGFESLDELKTRIQSLDELEERLE